MLNALIVAGVVFFCLSMNELIGFSLLWRPIVVSPLVGLLMGDLQTGLIVGASLETIFMGIINVGGASAAEPGLAAALATAFSIQNGSGVEAAIVLAIPIAILGQQVKTLIYIFWNGAFTEKFTKLAGENKQKEFVRLHFFVWFGWWFLYALVPFFAMYFGSTAVESALNAIPEVIMNGLNIAGGLLPAVGMAMLLKMLWSTEIAVYFFLGFVLIAYFELPLIAVAVIGFIIAIIFAQIDFHFNKISNRTAPAAIVEDDGLSQEEEDFFA